MFGFTIVRKSTVADTRSPAERYRAKKAASAVGHIIFTQRMALFAVLAIMAAAMVSNFQRQLEFLLKHCTLMESISFPVSLDLLTVSAAAIISTSEFKRSAHIAGYIGLGVGVLGSGALSVIAPGDWIGRAVAAGVVLLIAVAKFVSAFAKVDPKALDSAEAEFVPPPAPPAPVSNQLVLTDDERAQMMRERRAHKPTPYDDMTPQQKMVFTMAFNKKIRDQRERQAKRDARLAVKTASADAELETAAA